MTEIKTEITPEITSDLPEIGCANPYSIAEELTGEKINWTEVEDDFDKIAECFGITKEGFLSDEMPRKQIIVSPQKKRAGRPAKDATTRFFEKYARPEDDSEETFKARREKAQAFFSAKKNEKSAKTAAKRSGRKTSAVTDNTETEPSATSDFSMSGYTWKEDGLFFNEAPVWSDVVQHGIGDCYFLSALTSVAYVDPYKLPNLAAPRSSATSITPLSPWHQIKFYVPDTTNSDYNLLSDRKKTVQTIYVSEDVLISDKTGKPYGAGGDMNLSGTEKYACWAGVYEKAFAKFLEDTDSDYPNISARLESGLPEYALKALLHTESVAVRTLGSSVTSEGKEAIWKLVKAANKYPTTATILSTQPAGNSSYYLNLGLYKSHVYSVLGGTDCYNNKQYVILRNPHGRNPLALKNNSKVYHKNWTLDYGYNNYHFQRLYGDDSPATSNGIFLLELDEFIRLFSRMEYNYSLSRR